MFNVNTGSFFYDSVQVKFRIFIYQRYIAFYS